MRRKIIWATEEKQMLVKLISEELAVGTDLVDAIEHIREFFPKRTGVSLLHKYYELTRDKRKRESDSIQLQLAI